MNNPGVHDLCFFRCDNLFTECISHPKGVQGNTITKPLKITFKHYHDNS